MAPTQTPYGYQPSLKQKFFTNLSKGAPVFIGKSIQFIMYWFVQAWRFAAEAIRDAITGR